MEKHYGPTFHPGGLKRLPKDPRDGVLGDIVQYPPLSELPEAFELPTLTIKNQDADGNLDFCTAYASDGTSELQEGVELYPPFSFAASKAISGDPKNFGQNLRDAMAAHTKYGAVEKKDITSEERTLTADQRRYFSNFSEQTKARARNHRKQAYVQTKGPYDAYDNVRAAIWKFREEKRAVVIGVQFDWSLFDYIFAKVTRTGGGHAMYVTGWDKDGLIAVNSYGRNAGKDGKHRINREVAEAYIKYFGGFMFIDMSPQDVKKDIRLTVLQVLERYGLKAFFAEFWERFIKPQVVLPPEPPPHISKISTWALAIQHEEGGKPQDHNTLAHNPGNLKYTPYTKSLGGLPGALASDGGLFCKFPTYEAGFKALCQFLTDAATGKLTSYKPTMSLYDFTKTYANPPPNHFYAKNVATALGVSVTIPINELL